MPWHDLSTANSGRAVSVGRGAKPFARRAPVRAGKRSPAPGMVWTGGGKTGPRPAGESPLSVVACVPVAGMSRDTAWSQSLTCRSGSGIDGTRSLWSGLEAAFVQRRHGRGVSLTRTGMPFPTRFYGRFQARPLVNFVLYWFSILSSNVPARFDWARPGTRCDAGCES